MKTVIKIDSAIFDAAVAEGKTAGRSTAKQIEHWVEIGRRSEFTKRVDAERFSKTQAELLSEDFDRRAKDALFEKNDFIFVASERGAGYIDKMMKDGKRITGKLIDDVFTECGE